MKVLCVLLLFAVVASADDKKKTRPVVKVQEYGLVWYPGDATDKLIGKRNWYVGEKWLYIAVSRKEAQAMIAAGAPDFRPISYSMLAWKWAHEGGEDAELRSVKYDNHPAFLAMRGDVFYKHRAAIQAVYKGKLPTEILRQK